MIRRSIFAYHLLLLLRSDSVFKKSVCLSNKVLDISTNTVVVEVVKTCNKQALKKPNLMFCVHLIFNILSAVLKFDKVLKLK